MEIRAANLVDKPEIIALAERSQAHTGLPDPAFVPATQLGARLYERRTIERFVAVEAGRIVGHAITEEPNSSHEEAWRHALDDHGAPLVEMGAAFVEPNLFGRGIWTSLLKHRLQIIRKASACPVAATWSSNEHVKRTFQACGGINAGQQSTAHGDVTLFVFHSANTGE